MKGRSRAGGRQQEILAPVGGDAECSQEVDEKCVSPVTPPDRQGSGLVTDKVDGQQSSLNELSPIEQAKPRGTPMSTPRRVKKALTDVLGPAVTRKHATRTESHLPVARDTQMTIKSLQKPNDPPMSTPRRVKHAMTEHLGPRLSAYLRKSNAPDRSEARLKVPTLALHSMSR